MARRSLADVTRRETERKAALDEADRLMERMNAQQEAPQPTRTIPRNTARLSVSLLPEERRAVERLMGQLWQRGYTDIKISRLTRIALRMLLQASDDDIVRLAEEVPNLEKRV